MRKVSPYSGPNILLGVFDSEDKAESARKSYLSRYAHKAHTADPDPWEKQAYADGGLDDKDLITQAITVADDVVAGEIFIVSTYVDSLGMITREINAVFASYERAMRKAIELDVATEKEETYSGTLCEFLIQKVSTNTLLSDRPEDQPKR